MLVVKFKYICIYLFTDTVAEHMPSSTNFSTYRGISKWPEAVKHPQLFELKSRLHDDKETKPSRKEKSEIQFTELFNCIDSTHTSHRKTNVTLMPPPRHVMVRGGSGSGKTVLLRRFAEEAVLGIKGETYIHNLENIKAVFFVDLKVVNKTEDMILKEFMFDFMSLVGAGESTQDELYENLIANKGQDCLLIIDGLENIKIHRLDDKHSQIDVDKRYEAYSIVNAILNDYILPNAKLLSSSMTLEGDIRRSVLTHDRLIEIGGFKTNDIDEMIMQLGGEDGEKILNILKNHNRHLYYLCHNPTYMSCIIVVLKAYSDVKVKTITGIIAFALCALFKNEMYKETRNNQVELVNIFCEIAFTSKLDVNKEFDIWNTAKPNLISDLLCKYNNYIFFKQTIFKEFFCALHMCLQHEDNLLVEHVLRDSNDDFANTFICGILFDDNLQNAIKELSRDQLNQFESKRIFLQQHMVSVLFKDKKLNGMKNLRLAFECNYKFPVESIDMEIDCGKMSKFDAFCLLTFISRTKINQLKVLNLYVSVLKLICEIFEENEAEWVNNK